MYWWIPKKGPCKKVAWRGRSMLGGIRNMYRSETMYRLIWTFHFSIGRWRSLVILYYRRFSVLTTLIRRILIHAMRGYRRWQKKVWMPMPTRSGGCVEPKSFGCSSFLCFETMTLTAILLQPWPHPVRWMGSSLIWPIKRILQCLTLSLCRSLARCSNTDAYPSSDLSLSY